MDPDSGGVRNCEVQKRGQKGNEGREMRGHVTNDCRCSSYVFYLNWLAEIVRLTVLSAAQA